MAPAVKAALLGLVVLFMLGSSKLVAGRALLQGDDDLWEDDCAEKRSETPCLRDRECAWCTGKGPLSGKRNCVSAGATKYITDAGVGTCKGRMASRAVSKCDNVKAKDACLRVDDDDQDCAWCSVRTVGAAAARCVPKDAVQFHPSFTKSCEFRRRENDDDDNDDDNNNNNNNNDDDDNDDDNNDDDEDDK